MDTVVLVGLVIGSILLAVAAVGWLIRPREFGAGGVALLIAGAFLVTFSVWRTVTIEAGDGLTVRVERIEQQVDQMAEANVEVAQGVQEVAERVEVTGTQVLTLTDALARREVISADQRNAIARSLEAAPPADPARFQAITERLRALPRR